MIKVVISDTIEMGFLIKNIGSERNEVEADYAWVFFTLSAPAYFGKKDIYINGQFNNYALLPGNKMDYNAENAVYEKAIMIKQGFTNYQYMIADKNGTIDQVVALNPLLFNKAEGLSFFENGDLLISNEGQKGNPTLLKFNLKP